MYLFNSSTRCRCGSDRALSRRGPRIRAVAASELFSRHLSDHRASEVHQVVSQRAPQRYTLGFGVAFDQQPRQATVGFQVRVSRLDG
jgi:hypothetical protein